MVIWDVQLQGQVQDQCASYIRNIAKKEEQVLHEDIHYQ